MTTNNRYVKCPNCNGPGVITVIEYYTDYYYEAEDMNYDYPDEVTSNCSFCKGDGKFTEADYLIMKLKCIV
jgi:DnaJ-class molecular chaperone